MKPARRDLRSIEQNALLHVICREILAHLIDNGVNMHTGDTGEQIVKDLVKRKLGLKFVVGGVELDKPTRLYNTAELADFTTAIIAWAAHDLNLEIEI